MANLGSGPDHDDSRSNVMIKADRKASAEGSVHFGLSSPSGMNLGLAALALGVECGVLLGPSLLRAHQLGLLAGILVSFLVLTPMHWGLIHEGIHGRLLAGAGVGPGANRAASRILAIFFGLPFELVRFGHLVHHRFNGHVHDRPERIKTGESRWTSCARHYSHLLGGHYFTIGIIGLLMFCPGSVRRWVLERALADDGAEAHAITRAALNWSGNHRLVGRARVDFLACLALGAATVFAYGVYWPLFAATLLARAFVFSVLDNLPHYGTTGRGDDSAYDLHLPAWAAWLVLHHNLHRAHHEHPEIAWTEVRQSRSDAPLHGSYVRAALRQFMGPRTY